MLNEERKRKSIGQKTIIGIIVFTLLLIIAVRKKGSIYELIRYRHSPALATLEGITFNERSFTLDPGDSLFVFTDGVTEATAGDKKLFGEDRLVLALNKNNGADPEDILKNVRESIDAFVGYAPQFDDSTMLAFRYNGK